MTIIKWLCIYNLFSAPLSPNMSILTSFFMSPVAPDLQNYFSVTVSSNLIVEHILNLKRVTYWNTTHH